MQAIDSSLCASLLRGFTDQLLAAREPFSAELSLEETISRIRAVSDATSRAMRSALASAYPHIAWEKEEIEQSGDMQAKQSSEAHWIYDPIDGAYHFLQQLPLWSSSLALVENSETVFSMVYDPVTHELYTASKAEGTWLNGERLQTSTRRSLETAVLGTAIPPRRAATAEEHAQALRQLSAIAAEVFVVRPMASASLQLAYVAAGKLDGYWEVGHDVNDWLAGSLLVQEAGGTVTSFETENIGLNVDGIVAAPAALHRSMRNILLRK